MPNVDTVTEMVDLIDAQRAYEANVTAMHGRQADVRQDPGDPPLMTIDPSFAVAGAEWQVRPVEGDRARLRRRRRLGLRRRCSATRSGAAKTQNDAAAQAHALATGQADDPTAVVMAVERAQLAMQLAGQIRTKAVEAAQDIFHTQV